MYRAPTKQKTKAKSGRRKPSGVQNAHLPRDQNEFCRTAEKVVGIGGGGNGEN
jgi:hypothetical protein